MISTATKKHIVFIFVNIQLRSRYIIYAEEDMCVLMNGESETNCVDASVFPSGLKAAAIVDLGGGCRGQYLADKCSNDFASTL